MDQHDPLVALFARAKQHHVSMAAICSRANIDPTTPSRWRRKKNGARLEKVVALNAALSDIIRESGIGAPTPSDTQAAA